MTEQVVHPDHYNQYEGFEVIDVCEQLRSPDGTGNFNRGNAFKYLARAGWKNPTKEVEDLEKAVFYLQREIERIKARRRCPDCGDCGDPLIFSGPFSALGVCPYGHGSFIKANPDADLPPEEPDDIGDYVRRDAEVINKLYGVKEDAESIEKVDL